MHLVVKMFCKTEQDLNQTAMSSSIPTRLRSANNFEAMLPTPTSESGCVCVPSTSRREIASKNLLRLPPAFTAASHFEVGVRACVRGWVGGWVGG